MRICSIISQKPLANEGAPSSVIAVVELADVAPTGDVNGVDDALLNEDVSWILFVFLKQRCVNDI